MQEFELWDLPISTFCKKILSSTAESEKLKKDLSHSQMFFQVVWVDVTKWL